MDGEVAATLGATVALEATPSTIVSAQQAQQSKRDPRRHSTGLKSAAGGAAPWVAVSTDKPAMAAGNALGSGGGLLVSSESLPSESLSSESLSVDELDESACCRGRLSSATHSALQASRNTTGGRSIVIRACHLRRLMASSAWVRLRQSHPPV